MMTIQCCGLRSPRGCSCCSYREWSLRPNRRPSPRQGPQLLQPAARSISSLHLPAIVRNCCAENHAKSSAKIAKFASPCSHHTQWLLAGSPMACFPAVATCPEAATTVECPHWMLAKSSCGLSGPVSTLTSARVSRIHGRTLEDGGFHGLSKRAPGLPRRLEQKQPREADTSIKYCIYKVSLSLRSECQICTNLPLINLALT